jgi:predicted phage terminase large subunit-like protein
MLLSEAMRSFNPLLLDSPEGRMALTKHDPLLFAAIYLPHKLKTPSSEAPISLCQFHLDVIEYAKTWYRPLSATRKQRDSFIAPRETGKSTWIFHILPIWAAAHGHKKYILAFSDSDTQAKGWLLNFKQEIMTNKLLASDFPALVEPERLSAGARAYQDNRNVTQRSNGFIFQVAGADSNVLGANMGGRRPEVLLFDDIEPTESNYSAYEARKRLNTVLSAHFYLNQYAIVAFVGTTTMPDSIIDQIRKVGELRNVYDGDETTFRDSLEPDYRWVVDHQIKSHYYPAILELEDGSEASLWPEKWPLEELNKERGTREFAMNMMNRPISLDGGYWDDADIVVDEPDSYGNTLISVDPAVTTKRNNDYTGIAVISRGSDNRLYVRHAEQVRKNSEDLKDHVESLIKEYGAKVLYIETNQGGDLWKQVFSGISAKYRSVHQKEKKEVRAAQAHDIYKRGQVRHSKYFPSLTEQMLAFPRVPHDDVLDAVVSGVLYFNKPGSKVTAKQIKYMEVSK